VREYRRKSKLVVLRYSSCRPDLSWTEPGAIAERTGVSVTTIEKLPLEHQDQVEAEDATALIRFAPSWAERP
jgi:hypothetical protein